MEDSINDIILNTSLDKLYFAMIDTQIELDDEKLEKIFSGEDIIYQDMTDEELYEFRELFKEQANLYIDRKISKEELLSLVSEERYITILTMINGLLFDVCLNKYLDLNTSRVVNYEKVSNLYNDDTARVVINSDGKPWVDFTNLFPYHTFAYASYNQMEDDDLTQELIDEINGKVIVYSSIHNN